MKKLFVLLLTFFVFNAVAKAQYVTIPDDELRSYLQSRYPGCFNASNMLDTTCPAIVNETDLHIAGTGTISNWDGFQYFHNLQSVIFEGSSFSSFPVLPNTLKHLAIKDGYSQPASLPSLPAGLTHLTLTDAYTITSLPVLPNTLVYLNCANCTSMLSITSFPSSLKYLDCSGNTVLQSLPAFPASLDTIFCFDCTLHSLPALPASLKILNCARNFIGGITSFPSSLIYIDCSYNSIFTLPALPPQLEYLNAGSTEISALPVLPASLTTLIVNANSIASLPATFPPGLINLNIASNYTLSGTLPQLPAGLTKLDCSGCNLVSLPSLPAGLLEFNCGSNLLTSIPALSSTLQTFSCDYNHLTALPSLPPTLTNINCSFNQLTSLPALPGGLTTLNCSSNHISFLPAIPTTLNWIFCNDNDITCLPVFPVGSTLLGIDMDDKINCIPRAFPGIINLYVNNTPQGNFINGYDYPLCSAVNNVHHCDAFPLMTGHVYYDNNNNLIKDANEPFKANAKIQLPNGVFTMTNSNGYYQIPADSIGNYSLTATAPNFFAAVPLQYNYNFNSYDTLVTGNFALQATSTVDSLTISVLPINWAARPGFPFPYLISYQNVGTTSLSPNIIFNYDSSRLIYDSSSNASVTNSGSALSLAEPGFVAGEQKAFVGYFRVNPAAVIGDSIRAYASIHANAITAYDSTITGIRGAFDPNDKSATPKLSPSQVTNGNYIYYTIRFQNTGTDTAFSVVITDTLNSQLQAATLQVINTSHPAKITVKGNVVYFEFINILLPDSNVNEMKSHGYVTFRMKPQPTVILNSVIPNKAAIYFDYNSPVITNTAVTNIVEPQGPLPLKLISFNVLRSIGNNANAFWNTSNEINVQSYNIEMSLDGRHFNNISFERAKGYQYNDYTKTFAIPDNDILYFRLKMIDVDGRFTYSPIVTLRNDKSNSFSFLNNPVKNELNISIQDDALRNTTAKIYNAQGSLVKTILLQHDFENINVRSLSAGTYYFVTEKGNSQFIIIK